MRFFLVYLKNCDQKWSWQLYRPAVFLRTPVFQFFYDYKNSKSNGQCDCHKLSEFDTYNYLYSSVAYLDPSEKSKMELFCENIERLLAVNHFCKTAPS